MEKLIYLDNAATTSLSPEVLDAMLPYLKDEYGNPSSNYPLGVRARQAVGNARHVIAESIGAEDDEIYFTSGSTEAINWIVDTYRDRYISYSSIEHHAVINAVKEKADRRIYEIPVDQDGMVSTNDISSLLKDDPVSIVFTMWANNEIGSIEPVKQIGEICKEANIAYFADATQAYMHIPVSVDDRNINYLCASAHKFHGPKGVGFLYAKKGSLLLPYHCGGQQERGFRAGTENVAGIVGMAKAVEIAQKTLDAECLRQSQLTASLWQHLSSMVPNLKLNGYDSFSTTTPSMMRLPNNLNVCVDGVNGAELVELLGEMNICISAGSACNSESSEPSHVLKAIGLSDEDARNSVRLTIGEDTTMQDIDDASKCFAECVQRLRLYK